MSNMFSKLQYFSAHCTFCGEKGNVFGAYANNNKEVAVCPICADKLVKGITAALNELDKKKVVDIVPEEEVKQIEAEVVPDLVVDK
jgi:hypothetical protein